jgi:hypothetical protein
MATDTIFLDAGPVDETWKKFPVLGLRRPQPAVTTYYYY